ncbi:MAG: HAMP domain-containing sensor histidine kinase [Propionibacteriales bacterium]|nr:HAMP domain-containing sensor histidine kinase [Propionibacteriales bacterium]
MSPTERARDHRLLVELSRINNDYGILQRQAMRDLARSRHELSEAHQVLGAVAHDLRSPLQAVIGFAEFLLEEDLDPEQHELAERIARSGRMMSELTEDLLIALTTRGAPRVTSIVDLVALVSEVVSRFNLLARRSGAEIAVHLTAPQQLLIHGDATRLSRVVENLVTNATKFSSSGGTVEVTVTVDGHEAELTVTDQGPGIDPAEHRAIFEPFHRAAGSAAVPGVGLGLPIVTQIVDQHRGRVTVKSRPGEGASFVVRLPLRQSEHD